LHHRGFSIRVNLLQLVSSGAIAAEKYHRRVVPAGQRSPGLNLADWLAIHQQVLYTKRTVAMGHDTAWRASPRVLADKCYRRVMPVHKHGCRQGSHDEVRP